LAHQVCQIITFCARKRRKAATWLQEEEYSEWVMGLYWIYICSKGLCKLEGTEFGSGTMGVCRGFAVNNCSEWVADALKGQGRLAHRLVIIVKTFYFIEF
jgi:hypothetical protein